VRPDGAPGVVVKRVKEGGAAEGTRAVAPGDRVMLIDGAPLAGGRSRECAALVMGPPGSAAVLQLRKRDGSLREVTVVRGSGAAQAAGGVAPERSLDYSDAGSDAGGAGGAARRCGIGLTFVRAEGRGGLLVKRVKPGGPAALSGAVVPGERLMRLDGRDVAALSNDELARAILGNPGSQVRLFPGPPRCREGPPRDQPEH
jgi:C-terminal processing protease CtpA/Prc